MIWFDYQLAFEILGDNRNIADWTFDSSDSLGSVLL